MPLRPTLRHLDAGPARRCQRPAALPWASHTSSARTSSSIVMRCGLSMSHVDMYASSADSADQRRTFPPYTRCIVTRNAIHRDSRWVRPCTCGRLLCHAVGPEAGHQAGLERAARRGTARLRARAGARRRPPAPAAQCRPVRRHRLLLPVQRSPVGPLAGAAPADHAGGRAVDRLAEAIGEDADRPRPRTWCATIALRTRAGRRQGVRDRRRMVRPEARGPQGDGDHSWALQRPARLGQRRLLGRPGRLLCGRAGGAGTPAPAPAAGHRAEPCGTRTRRCSVLAGDQLVADGRAERGRRRRGAGRVRRRGRAGRPAYPGFIEHPFPTCFVCGPRREDGLRHLPGPAARRPDRRPVRRTRPMSPTRSCGPRWTARAAGPCRWRPAPTCSASWPYGCDAVPAPGTRAWSWAH